ncbi:MAG: ABC transporter ATP-binding protein [Oscillospiraceae bacterium]|nr:ABC transporter ATP-binding protein [Oscillospiraceae bacterium]
MIRRFIQYYKPQKKLFFWDMVAAFFISVCDLFYPIITRNMLNDYIPNRQMRLLLIFSIALVAIYFIKMLLNYFVQYYGHMVGVYMQADMRRDLFRHLQKLPFSFFDENETGNIMSRVVNDLQDISELAHHGPEDIFISSVMIIGSFVYLSSINLLLTVIIFLFIPLLVWFSLAMRKRMNVAFMESRRKVAVVNATLESSISGIRVAKAFTNSAFEEEKFQSGNGKFVKAREMSYKAMGQFFAGTGFITDMFNVVVILAGGVFTYRGTISYGDFAAFMLFVNLFINPVKKLINFMEQYQNGMTGFQRFCELIDQPIEKERPDAGELTDVKGEICFEQVNFTYGDSKEVLHDINLTIRPGEKLALVGPSGGGKSTICHLIPNFYELDSGMIRIDGKPIDEITFASLRKNIGIVQQDVFLFNGSIRENIAYGDLDASGEEIIQAAKRANIHDYVMSMPEGYETNIGERGIKLSGGQKQRLSIARVFLKNPAILILDEATSALDNTTEALIQNALDELCQGRTTIVVAHRLSTIKNADEIAVVTKGRIVEKGTHEALLAQGGIYKELYESQFKPSSDRTDLME